MLCLLVSSFCLYVRTFDTFLCVDAVTLYLVVFVSNTIRDGVRLFSCMYAQGQHEDHINLP